MKELGKRTAVSAIAIVVLVVLFFFAHAEIAKICIACLIAALAAVATWEYAELAKARGARIYSVLLAVLSAIVAGSFFGAGPLVFPVMVLFLALLFLFAIHFRRTERAILDLASSSFALLYIAIPLGMILSLFFLPGGEGRTWAIYLLAVTKGADMGGYFGGSLFGKRKLAPKISPAKTIEGAFFGVLFALVVSDLFYRFGANIDASFDLSRWESMGLGLLLGCVGQFGDLVESMFKRDANRKDSNALPGIGGALDMVDSLLLNAPILYFYLFYLS